MSGEDIKTRVCSRCGQELPLTEEFFNRLHTGRDGFGNKCKSCIKTDHEKITETAFNKTLLLAKREYSQQKGATENDWDGFVAWARKQRKRDWGRDLWRTYWEQKLKKIRRLELQSLRARENKSVLSDNHINSNSIFKLKQQVRSTIYQSFSRTGYATPNQWTELTELDSSTLVPYLLQTFKRNYGREWDGTEPVEVDHIIPLSMAKTEEDVIWLCRYTNLQLLTRSDNRAKSNKLNYQIGGI